MILAENSFSQKFFWSKFILVENSFRRKSVFGSQTNTLCIDLIDSTDLAKRQLGKTAIWKFTILKAFVKIWKNTLKLELKNIL